MTIYEFMRDIAPKMRPGWVAMHPDNSWCWFSEKPDAYEFLTDEEKAEAKEFGVGWDVPGKLDYYLYLECFDIAPVDNWTKSLREVGKC